MNSPISLAQKSVAATGVPDSVRISVILPIYEEALGLEDCIVGIMAELDGFEGGFEIIAVDDGSTDGSDAILDKIAEEHPGLIRVVSHPYNRGMGAAIKTGIRMARGEIIVSMDSDGQHDPADILTAAELVGQYDLVIGARGVEYGGRWHRNLGNGFFNRLASLVTGFPIDDLTSGFRAFRASAVRRFVDLFPEGFSYATTSTLAFVKAGYTIRFFEINARPRSRGTSKIMVFRDGLRFLLIILRIVVIFRPMRVFLPTSAVFLALGILSTAQATWVAGRLDMPNSGVLFTVISVVVFLMGLIAEQNAALQILTREQRRA